MHFIISFINDLLPKTNISCAMRVPGGRIVLSQERTERSRTIPLFRKNEHLERFLKNIGRISKRTVKIVKAFLLLRTRSKHR